MKIDGDGVGSTSLEWARPFADAHQDVKFLMQPSGEHYKLLAHMAAQLRNAHLVDIGTGLGHSALALAYRAEERGNRVTTYDIVDHMAGQERCARHHPAVRFELRDAADDIADIAKTAHIVVLDVDGIAAQRNLATSLIALGFRGLLVVDDIKLTKEMEAMWGALPAQRKIDATELGHWSGTGIAALDTSFADVELVRTVPTCGWSSAGKML